MKISTPAKKIIKSIMFILSIISVVWVLYILSGSIEEIKNSLVNIDYRWVIGILLGNCISGYIAFEGFRLIFERVQPNIYSRYFLAHLYFVGQLMKHLPGRVLGVAYQMNIGNKTSAPQWIGINAAYMLLTTAFAVGVACTVAAAMFNVAAGIGVTLIGVLTYFICWQPTVLRGLNDYLYSKNIKIMEKAIKTIIAIASSDRAFQFKVLAFFITSWIIYLVAWAGYGMAWPGLTALDGIWLCGIYTLAWFLGYISFVSPSGFGIREAAFFVLAVDFPPDAVAGMAVLGRVVLLLVDFILGFIFFAAGDGNGEKVQ
jgi:hypothetical protein